MIDNWLMIGGNIFFGCMENIRFIDYPWTKFEFALMNLWKVVDRVWMIRIRDWSKDSCTLLNILFVIVIKLNNIVCLVSMGIKERFF